MDESKHNETNGSSNFTLSPKMKQLADYNYYCGYDYEDFYAYYQCHAYYAPQY
ncbi:hypothetical protein BKA80DRAFT_306986 [Phyllosticta citrichinensis]